MQQPFAFIDLMLYFSDLHTAAAAVTATVAATIVAAAAVTGAAVIAAESEKKDEGDDYKPNSGVLEKVANAVHYDTSFH